MWKLNDSFFSRASKIHFHKKGFARSLVIKVRVFGTRKWLIQAIGRFQMTSRRPC